MDAYIQRLQERYVTIRAAAAALGQKEQTVYKWGLRGVPPRHRKAVDLLLNGKRERKPLHADATAKARP